MSYARQMLDTYPTALVVDAGVLAAAIDAITECAQACIADTDADLSEQNVAEMIRCIRLCLDCADVCAAAAGVISRPAGYDANVTLQPPRACGSERGTCEATRWRSRRLAGLRSSTASHPTGAAGAAAPSSQNSECSDFAS